VANYTTGSVAALPVAADGSLGEAKTFIQHTGSSVDKTRQGEPHAHSIVVSPDNRFVFAADLGLDQVLAYRWSRASQTDAQPAAVRRTLPGGMGRGASPFIPTATTPMPSTSCSTR
jgi:6-phosphogluconolactonase